MPHLINVETTVYKKGITTEGLDSVLKKSKNRNSPGTDNLNVELFKYGRGLLKNTCYNYLITYSISTKYPKDCKTGNINKKGSL